MTITSRNVRLIPKDDHEAAEILTETLKEDGVDLQLDSQIVQVEKLKEGNDSSKGYPTLQVTLKDNKT